MDFFEIASVIKKMLRPKGVSFHRYVVYKVILLIEGRHLAAVVDN